jgi:uncharacterized membrane protein YkvA (DUF1232 family)
MKDSYEDEGNMSSHSSIGDIKTEDIHRIKNEIPDKISSLEHSSSNSIKELLHHVRTAYAMLLDKSFSLHWKSKALLISGLLYFLLPTDLTPDFIPLIGYIDDAAVLTAIFKSLATDIKKYRIFKGL